MLTITKLRAAEYLISSVARGMEDYYMGAGEAPGVWQGRWAESLGLEGVVAAAELRALGQMRRSPDSVRSLVPHLGNSAPTQFMDACTKSPTSSTSTSGSEQRSRSAIPNE